MPTIKSQSAFGLRVWSHKSPGMRQAHLHQDLEFNYVLSGTMTYLIGGSLLSIPQGKMGVIWGAMPHQTILPAVRPSLFWVTIPLNRAMLWNLPEQFVRRLLGRGLVVDPHTNNADPFALRQWKQDLADDRPLRREMVLEEIARRLHRLALNVIEDAPPATPGVDAAPPSSDALLTAQRMAGLIGRHFHEPLTVSQIADAVDLHPNYAMTLFRRQTGMTINTYLTRQRVAHAQSLLATTTMPILHIGEACGFGSTSRFYEAFKKEALCTPRQFRTRLARPR